MLHLDISHLGIPYMFHSFILQSLMNLKPPSQQNWSCQIDLHELLEYHLNAFCLGAPQLPRTSFSELHQIKLLSVLPWLCEVIIQPQPH